MVLWALRKSTGNHWVFPMKAVVAQAERHSPKLRGAAQWPSGSCSGAEGSLPGPSMVVLTPVMFVGGTPFSMVSWKILTIAG